MYIWYENGVSFSSVPPCVNPIAQISIHMYVFLHFKIHIGLNSNQRWFGFTSMIPLGFCGLVKWLISSSNFDFFSFLVNVLMIYYQCLNDLFQEVYKPSKALLSFMCMYQRMTSQSQWKRHYRNCNSCKYYHRWFFFTAYRAYMFVPIRSWFDLYDILWFSVPICCQGILTGCCTLWISLPKPQTLQYQTIYCII